MSIKSSDTINTANASDSFIKTKVPPRFYLFLISVLIILISASRGASYICSLSATDVAYPAWVEVFTSYISEILVAVRLAFSFAAITFAVYNSFGTKSVTIISVLFSISDFAARFIIDLFTDAVSGNELVAVIWLSLNFLYELVFIILAYIIARIMKLKLSGADSERQRKKYTGGKALQCSIILYMLSHLVSEIFYLVDFLLSYVNITNTEIASIVGSFLRIFVVYGGISLIAGILFTEALEKMRNKKNTVK